MVHISTVVTSTNVLHTAACMHVCNFLALKANVKL